MKHHRTAGVTTSTVEIGGKKYTLRPMKVGQYAEIEAYIISIREDPLESAVQACKIAPAEMHAAIWDAAMRAAKSARIVTAAEITAFENSIRGVAFKFWMCLKGAHPEIDNIEKAIELIEVAGGERIEEIHRKIQSVSGERDLGNSSGQTVAAAAVDPQAVPPAGPSSTSDSPSPTVGPPPRSMN